MMNPLEAVALNESDDDTTRTSRFQRDEDANRPRTRSQLRRQREQQLRGQQQHEQPPTSSGNSPETLAQQVLSAVMH